MTYYFIEHSDGEPSLVALPDGITVSFPDEQGRYELKITADEFSTFQDQLKTHHLTFDTVEQRLKATPRETMPLSGDQSD